MRKLDPRTKFVIMVSISTAAMLVNRIPYLISLFLFLVMIMTLGGISFQRQKKQLLTGTGMAAFLFFLQALMGQYETGAILVLRLLIVILSAVMLLTSPPRDYLLAMVQCRIPYELAYMVILAFHFFPILREEALDVYYSMQLRGKELQKCTLKEKLKAFQRMCIPILSAALERARDTSIAMEARRFRALERRTYMRRLKLKLRDILIMLCMPVLAVVFIGCASLDTGDDSIADQIILMGRTENSMIVSWSYKEAYDGILEYDGKSVDAVCTEIKEDEYYRYEAVMDDLQQGRTYSYAVGNGEVMTKKRKASLAESDDFTFLYIGDIQYQLRDRDYTIWGDFLKEMYESHPESAFGLFAGDMVDKGPDLDDWKAFFTNAEPIFSKIPMLATVGNHETSILSTMYKKMLAMPDNGCLSEEMYSFDYGNAHIISLNSCLFLKERMGEEGYEDTIDSVQEWLEQDLSQSDAPWKIVLMHHPMYPVSDDNDIYETLRDNWEDILVAGGVKLVLCGHQHLYMRTEAMQGIAYVMANSGEKRSYYVEEGTVIPDYVEAYQEEGSNYVTVRVTEDSLVVQAYGENGQKIDEVTIP